MCPSWRCYLATKAYIMWPVLKRGFKSIWSLLRHWYSKKARKMPFKMIFESSVYLKRLKSFGQLQVGQSSGGHSDCHYSLYWPHRLETFFVGTGHISHWHGDHKLLISPICSMAGTLRSLNVFVFRFIFEHVSLFVMIPFQRFETRKHPSEWADAHHDHRLWIIQGSQNGWNQRG